MAQPLFYYGYSLAASSNDSPIVIDTDIIPSTITVNFNWLSVWDTKYSFHPDCPGPSSMTAPVNNPYLRWLNSTYTYLTTYTEARLASVEIGKDSSGNMKIEGKIIIHYREWNIDTETLLSYWKTQDNYFRADYTLANGLNQSYTCTNKLSGASIP